MPKVSVILTSYNHEKYIRESIESVLNQTYRDFELIIVDDASQDESWDIIQSYKDERIVAIRNEKNIRAEGVYNAIKNVAKGKYIAIHHSDDAWMVNKLEKQISFLDQNAKYAAVFTLAEIIDEDGNIFVSNGQDYNIFDQPNRTRHEWLNYFFNFGNALCHPSVLFHKVCYQEYELFVYGYGQLPDFLKWIKICLNKDIFVLQEKLTKFRILNSSRNTSGDRPDAYIRSSIELFQVLNEFLKISDYNEFISVFPEGEKYLINGQFVSQFAFAFECLKSEKNKVYKLFGMLMLFEMVNDKELSEKIAKIYNFTYLDLIKLTGKNDIFGVIPPNKKIITLLYINTGDGYSEVEKIELEAYASYDMKFSFNYDIAGWKVNNDSKNIISLRFDPCEAQFCRCVIENVETDGIYRGVASKNNFREKDGWDEFLTNDPIYQLDGDFEKSTYLRISGKIQILNPHAVSVMLEEVACERRHLLEEISYYENVISDRNKHIEYLEKVVKDDSTHITNLENVISDRNKYIEHLESVLSERNEHAVALGKMAVNNEKYISDLNDQLNKIYKSKGWKLLSVLYQLFRTVHGLTDIKKSFTLRIGKYLKLKSDIKKHDYHLFSIDEFRKEKKKTYIRGWAVSLINGTPLCISVCGWNNKTISSVSAQMARLDVPIALNNKTLSDNSGFEIYLNVHPRSVNKLVFEDVETREKSFLYLKKEKSY